MRIIGGRDYYDKAGYQIDPSIVFVRKSADVPLESTPLYYAFNYSGIHRFEVVVAGEAYAGLCITRDGFPPKPPRIIYSSILAEQALKDYPDHIRTRFSDLSISDTRRKAIKEWALQNKVVTAISGCSAATPTPEYPRSYELFNWYRKATVLLNSDALKDIDFYRVLDPAQTHTAIQNWVGGVLPFNLPTVTISNDDKIKKAGFDKRISFRHRKTFV